MTQHICSVSGAICGEEPLTQDEIIQIREMALDLNDKYFHGKMAFRQLLERCEQLRKDNALMMKFIISESSPELEDRDLRARIEAGHYGYQTSIRARKLLNELAGTDK